MIVRHRLNSEWWGAPVGLIEDPAFFEQDEAAQRQALDTHAWVEFRGTHDPALALRLQDLGFLHAETYCRCRIGLARVAGSPSLNSWSVRSAQESPFDPASELEPFENERYDLLPGIDPAMIAARYARYIATLIESAPQSALEISGEREVQGWFFAEPQSSETIRLTLAARRRGATASGAHLYQRALLEYARQGYRIGTATFTVRHPDVMNIYARLGAVFVEPLEIWLRVSSARSSSQT